MREHAAVVTVTCDGTWRGKEGWKGVIEEVTYRDAASASKEKKRIHC